MKGLYRIFLLGAVLLFLLIAGCAPQIPQTARPTLTTTPCLKGNTIRQTAVSSAGRSNPATPFLTQPVFSPQQQATMEARLGQANPGSLASALPPCETPSPTAVSLLSGRATSAASNSGRPAFPAREPATRESHLANPDASTTSP